jgi:hypothetical protein
MLENEKNYIANETKERNIIRPDLNCLMDVYKETYELMTSIWINLCKNFDKKKNTLKDKIQGK